MTDLEQFAAALTGQYEVVREIGRGGMGVVYLARDPRLDRPVAIKTLPPHLASDPVVRERFLREARTAAKLSHQNIVPIHRADEIAGRVFFVMGFVDGDSLAQRIRDGGPLAPSESLGIARDVASALGYAHEHGVIHRDVKAENILLDRATGRAMVTDFGIARLAEAAPLTATGQLLGTVYYVSPEQVSGDPVDARSDIYSLGVTLYYALSGHFPFDAPLASAVLVSHVTKAAPPLATVTTAVPLALARVVDRCLAKDPAARFQSCREFLTTLEQIEGEVAAAVAGPVVAPAAPMLVSDTEAQAIWGRAAELQAVTGLQPRPAALLGARDAQQDATRTTGFSTRDIRQAAEEAGIARKYVAAALAEHGLTTASPSGGAGGSVVIADRSKPASRLAGSPMQLEYETVLDGEMPESDFDLLIDAIRKVTGEAGLVAGVGRSFSWSSGQSRQGRRVLHVSVLARGGKTTIRATESQQALAGGLFGGIMGGYGGGTTGLWAALGAATHSPAVGISLWVANLGVAFLAARGFFRMGTRKRRAKLQELVESLARQAETSIAAGNPRRLSDR